MRLKLNPTKIAVVLGSIAVLLALQSIYSEYVLANILGMDANTAPARILDLFSVNLEESLPTWYSTINLFLAASLLAWIALSKRLHHEPQGVYWIGLSAIFFYLSMDEGSAIHETASGPLQRAFDTSGFLEFGWLILGVPLVLIFGIAYFRFWLRLPAGTRTLFAIAAALYVGGAIVIEAISANVYSAAGGSNFLYLAIATVEELCEMLGVVVFIYALLDYLRVRREMLIMQTEDALPEFGEARLGWRYSLPRTATLFALVLLAINGGLLLWGIALRDQTPVTAAAPYHFYILVEELAGEGVNITHLPGVFNPADEVSRRTVSALAGAYPSVQVLALPAQNASIAVAADLPVLTEESIIELMEWIDETEYIFYDTLVVRAVLNLN